MRSDTLDVNGHSIPVTYCNTVIVGAGAAAMGCVTQLVRFWRNAGVENPQDKVLVVTGGISLGASRMSGSDKQTYYKMGTSPDSPDTAAEFAKTLTGFGCCHGDTSLIEGICSLRGFYHLVEAGVPFPHDPRGAFIGYKTDHDPSQRGTSAGPKTSRFMSQCLQAEAGRMGVRILDGRGVLKLITTGSGEDRRIAAMLCGDTSAKDGREIGLSLFVAENWVLAAGGPGEIYQTTVYPRGQYGIHGAAFEAGLEACNITESQFGLASTKFRWNVSGTYMQVAPRIFSTDADGGDEREFLTEYFDDMSSMATNIFLKGYQWPFDAQRIVDHQSSLIDMAVHQETVTRGRRVYMDFLRNPVGAPGWDEFSIDCLGEEALEYIRKAGAVQARPIDRLEHMNVPAIEIYRENGIDLFAEPLEIAVCAQHMNGGFGVNAWWESNVPHTFVIGEMAGTHGVKRPGGSALNAGQVGAMRAAQYIANVYGPGSDAGPADVSDAPELSAEVDRAVGWIDQLLAKGSTSRVTSAEAMAQMGERMTCFGAHLRSEAGSSGALAEAKRQYRELLEGGIEMDRPTQIPAVVRTIQQCLTHVAILEAICGMFARRTGSRGSHCILADDGIEMHRALIDPADGKGYRFRPENEDLRRSILYVRMKSGADVSAGELFDLFDVAPRPAGEHTLAFEPAWQEFRDGKIYR